MNQKEKIKKEILDITLLISKNHDISFVKDMAMIKLGQLVAEYKKLIEKNEDKENEK